MSWLREKIYHNEKIDLSELKEQKGIEMRDLLETMIVADMTFILDDKLQINVVLLYLMLTVSNELIAFRKLHSIQCYPHFVDVM
jgi:hypothetical protein